MANAWLRLWHDMPNDPKWRTIARVSGQPIATVMAVYIHLLVSASRNVTRGHIEVTTEDLASALDVTEEVIDSILQTMQGRVLDGDLITGWEKRQVLKEDNGNISQTAKSPAERKRAQRERERKREQNGDCHGASRNVMHMSRRVTTDKDTDKDKDKDKAIDKEKKKDAGTAKSVVRSFGTHKNIMLTSEQYNELESRCRSVGLSLESYISKLSQWLFTKGRHCTDPYRIISGWLDNDSKRKTAAKPKEKQGCDLSWYDDFAMNFDLSKFF